jgi:hypothetical protein
MLTTIELDHELGVRPEKIDDKSINRHLSFELPTSKSAVT